MKKLFIFGMSCFIVFFILGTCVWLFIEQKDKPITKLNRSFDHTHIEELVVNTDIVNVTFQEGKTFHMQYKGREQLNVTQQGRTVQVVERMNGKRKMLNLNPFITNAEELVVTLPPKHLKHLNVTTHIANVNMKDVKVDNVMVWNDQNGEVNLKDCQFKHTQIKGHETFVKIENSELTKGDVNVANGMIFANRTTVGQSLFKLGEGDMHLLKMSPECDLKGIANKGDIEMSYAQVPEHVRLKLQPTNGEAMVEHPNLKNGINGNGKHQIELYTNNGNIVVR
ncbi:hypothetical protein C7J88_04340 [Staphylococcus muscae]|uniref:Exported protein n=1 Tax=Staphylococcus muscae TaxID=1294 RepID=A0A240C7U6_9STAP|nr:DUF4097 family beta strand repeat-containing protein [Staphylococcus muscae]AVQ33439.1 hypothetical protein C7J88_04340 [Staphylococcus muscae]PNZ04339.1 hypothetical protein CD131_04830 [Staphylococcus muscae]GGA90175.1 hypothetical protein GCM10007183_13020 [Staphylococcus muscae]SNW03256.1 exported protein [Staphylococcus muscae]